MTEIHALIRTQGNLYSVHKSWQLCYRRDCDCLRTRAKLGAVLLWPARRSRRSYRCYRSSFLPFPWQHLVDDSRGRKECLIAGREQNRRRLKDMQPDGESTCSAKTCTSGLNLCRVGRTCSCISTYSSIWAICRATQPQVGSLIRYDVRSLTSDALK